MNKLSKSLSIAAATVLLAAPFTSQAGNEDAAMDACINAFVSANLPKEQPVKVRKEESAASPVSVHAFSCCNCDACPFVTTDACSRIKYLFHHGDVWFVTSPAAIAHIARDERDMR